jgi:hypothetical protein
LQVTPGIAKKHIQAMVTNEKNMTHLLKGVQMGMKALGSKKQKDPADDIIQKLKGLL